LWVNKGVEKEKKTAMKPRPVDFGHRTLANKLLRCKYIHSLNTIMHKSMEETDA